MSKQSLMAGAALAALLTLGACAGPSVTADAGLLQRVDSAMRQATPAMEVSLRLSAQQIHTGDALSAEIGVNTTGYVYLFQVGTDGATLSLVFPNAMDGANHVSAGSQLALPRPNWGMPACGPAGVGHLLAVLTDKPLDLVALQAGVQRGALELAPPYGAAMVTLREVAR